MLPWRRSKFVLVEEERNWKAKSLSGGLSYSSLLSSLLRACPELWAECSLDRLGNMFRSKRQKLELTREDPSYTVWYLGNAVTFAAKGDGCTDEAVGRIWAKCEQGTAGTKMKLTIGPHGIRMNQAEHKCRQTGHLYLLHRITYCGADSHHPKVLTWVYRHQVRNKAVVLRCHAVLVPKVGRARAMALLLEETATSAFNHFKRLKRQDDARHRQQQRLGPCIVPLTPMRRVLNSQCPYRPPAERGRSAPPLSSIAEDVLGEEEEEERGCGQMFNSNRSEPDICQISQQISSCSIGKKLTSLRHKANMCRLLPGESTEGELLEQCVCVCP
ncbi:protein FAM43B [Scyliorhinus canicula]|uniref:protein FAM43B n=1 Tax=Scyliorhinus canicula TaxID=7830 RepID=UPI0018F77440|nr:protein FAM43B [Scyliorhinus canicula]